VTTEIQSPVDKRDDRVRDMFAAIAPRYDLLNRLLSLRIDQRWRKRTVELVPADETTRPILDVCTGTGDLALLYAKRWPDTPVVGVDFCEPMLDIAKRKNLGVGSNVEFQTANAMSLPFPDGKFQLTTIAFGLRNVSDTDVGLRELRRVTAPGGRVAVLEFSTPTNPILRTGYLTYFKRILPWIGQRVSPNRAAAYEYLPASVLQFAEGDALVEKMNLAGLTKVWRKPFTFGVATLYVGTVPTTESTPPGSRTNPDTA
jgi:demethylmenaquinone methyltransferase/2-methoxy-6-polyprenyl-1,4-benzoquinol methylase